MLRATCFAPRRRLPQLRGLCYPNPRVPLPKSAALVAASARYFSSRSRTRLVKPSNFTISPPSHSTMTDKSKVLIFGAGNFGSCLADHLGDSSHEVWMWTRIPEQVECLNKEHRNPEVLQDHVFPDCIKAIGPDFPSPELVQSMDVLLFAIPTQAVRCVSIIRPACPLLTSLGAARTCISSNLRSTMTTCHYLSS